MPKCNLQGERFGKWVVINKAEQKLHGKTAWLCKCDCGTVRTVAQNNLVSGLSTNCGCVRKQNLSQKATHKETNSRLYGVWGSMMSRCYDKNRKCFKQYGEKGVLVCEEWHKYEVFRDWALANGYDKNASRGGCTIDRINVCGNYEPSNCRWVDMKTQCRNKRNTLLVEYCGRTIPLPVACEESGMKYRLVYDRIHALGWSANKALNTPNKKLEGTNNAD